MFLNYSRGAESGRDAWSYNSSPKKLAYNIKKMIDFYQEQLSNFANTSLRIDKFINTDNTKISWTSSLKKHLENGIHIAFSPIEVREALYRPFTKQKLYFSNNLIHRVGQIPKIFPNDSSVVNKVISVTGRGATKEFSALITDQTPDLEMISKGQCFPLSIYEELESSSDYSLSNATQRNATLYNRNSIKSKSCYLYIHNGKQRILSPYIRQHSRCTVTSQRSMLPALSVRNGQREQTMNLAICLSISGNKSFSALITDQIPDLHLIGDAQCFPLYLYETEENN